MDTYDVLDILVRKVEVGDCPQVFLGGEFSSNMLSRFNDQLRGQVDHNSSDRCLDLKKETKKQKVHVNRMSD